MLAAGSIAEELQRRHAAEQRLAAAEIQLREVQPPDAQHAALSMLAQAIAVVQGPDIATQTCSWRLRPM